MCTVTYKNTTGKDQKVVIKDKIPEHTTYVGPNQELLAGSKAVPMKITLPMAKADGNS